MRYKTLFRVLMKALGVYLFAVAAASLLSNIGTAIRFSSISSASSPYQGWYLVWTFAPPTVQMLFGLYLFFGGKWIANLAIPGNRPYCHQCGYDLTGAVGNVCNECGTPFRGEVTATHE
jgi:hypothetical protein